MTFKETKSKLMKIGIKITYLEDTEEYRIVPFEQSEDKAYYASDLDDAFHTGNAMARFHLDELKKLQDRS